MGCQNGHNEDRQEGKRVVKTRSSEEGTRHHKSVET